MCFTLYRFKKSLLLPKECIHSEYTATIFSNRVNLFFFVIEKQCVFCDVEDGYKYYVYIDKFLA
jgi:hypothetical protein